MNLLIGAATIGLIFAPLALGVFMGLEDRLDTPMGLLSGGQRQALTVLMATRLPLGAMGSPDPPDLVWNAGLL